jgi:hypothetical protein
MPFKILLSPCSLIGTCAGFEVLTEVVMKNSIFWNITPCSLLKVNRNFGGTCPSNFRVKNKTNNKLS